MMLISAVIATTERRRRSVSWHVVLLMLLRIRSLVHVVIHHSWWLLLLKVIIVVHHGRRGSISLLMLHIAVILVVSLLLLLHASSAKLAWIAPSLLLLLRSVSSIKLLLLLMLHVLHLLRWKGLVLSHHAAHHVLMLLRWRSEWRRSIATKVIARPEGWRAVVIHNGRRTRHIGRSERWWLYLVVSALSVVRPKGRRFSELLSTIIFVFDRCRFIIMMLARIKLVRCQFPWSRASPETRCMVVGATDKYVAHRVPVQ